MPIIFSIFLTGLSIETLKKARWQGSCFYKTGYNFFLLVGRDKNHYINYGNLNGLDAFFGEFFLKLG
jgi:hypothetical protein